MVLTVRPATATDAADATALLNQIIAIGGTTAMETPLSQAEVTEWFLLGDKVHCAHVALEGNAMVGWQSVGRNPDLPEGWGDMATFAKVGTTARGIGTALFAATRARAQALGLAHLNATIRADNTSGLAYYSRMGFADYDIAKGVPLANGQPMDRIKKRLAL